MGSGDSVAMLETYMKQTKDSSRKQPGPPPAPGEMLDYLVWRQLGFEDQFGESFLDPEEQEFMPHPAKEQPKITISNLPELTP